MAGFVFDGKKVVRAGHGKRALVEVVHKSRRAGAPVNHMPTALLHRHVRDVLEMAPAVKPRASVEEHEAADFNHAYTKLGGAYTRWQSTRISDDGIIQTYPYAEFAGMMLLARHILRFSILMDHYPDLKSECVFANDRWQSPRGLMANHAINLAYGINEEARLNQPLVTGGPARAGEFCNEHDMTMAITMLMRNCEGTGAAELLTNAMQHILPGFAVDPVKSDIAVPRSVRGMLNQTGAAGGHRTCT